MNRSLTRLKSTLAFEKGSWGAEIYEGLEPNLENGDVVVSKHWNSRYSNGPVWLAIAQECSSVQWLTQLGGSI